MTSRARCNRDLTSDSLCAISLQAPRWASTILPKQNPERLFEPVLVARLSLHPRGLSKSDLSTSRFEENILLLDVILVFYLWVCVSGYVCLCVTVQAFASLSCVPRLSRIIRCLITKRIRNKSHLTRIAQAGTVNLWHTTFDKLFSISNVTRQSYPITRRGSRGITPFSRIILFHLGFQSLAPTFMLAAGQRTFCPRSDVSCRRVEFRTPFYANSTFWDRLDENVTFSSNGSKQSVCINATSNFSWGAFSKRQISVPFSLAFKMLPVNSLSTTEHIISIFSDLPALDPYGGLAFSFRSNGTYTLWSGGKQVYSSFEARSLEFHDFTIFVQDNVVTLMDQWRQVPVSFRIQRPPWSYIFLVHPTSNDGNEATCFYDIETVEYQPVQFSSCSGIRQPIVQNGDFEADNWAGEPLAKYSYIPTNWSWNGEGQPILVGNGANLFNGTMTGSGQYFYLLQNGFGNFTMQGSLTQQIPLIAGCKYKLSMSFANRPWAEFDVSIRLTYGNKLFFDDIAERGFANVSMSKLSTFIFIAPSSNANLTIANSGWPHPMFSVYFDNVSIIPL